jgi:mRNA interferase MazF
MTIFKSFDVVSAPFPYVERPISKRRPCLLVGEPEGSGLIWVVMITSAKNAGWDGDVEISSLGEAGLAAPSVIRTAKIATVEASVLKPIGTLNKKTAHTAETQLLKHWKVK